MIKSIRDFFKFRNKKVKELQDTMERIRKLEEMILRLEKRIDELRDQEYDLKNFTMGK